MDGVKEHMENLYRNSFRDPTIMYQSKSSGTLSRRV